MGVYMFRKKNYWIGLCAAVLMLVVGIFLAIIGCVIFTLNKPVKDKCTAVTYGVVVSVSKTTQLTGYRSRETYYVAQVKPDDRSIFNNDKLVTERTRYNYQKGERVEIHYDPVNSYPYYVQHAEPSTEGVYFIVIGAFVIFLGVAVFIGNKLNHS